MDRTSGAPSYLCSLCVAAARGGSRELHSDEERAASREKLETAAFGFGSFLPGGHWRHERFSRVLARPGA